MTWRNPGPWVDVEETLIDHLRAAGYSASAQVPDDASTRTPRVPFITVHDSGSSPLSTGARSTVRLVAWQADKPSARRLAAEANAALHQTLIEGLDSLTTVTFLAPARDPDTRLWMAAWLVEALAQPQP